MTSPRFIRMAGALVLLFSSVMFSACEEECCQCPDGSWLTANGVPVGQAWEYCEEDPYVGDSIYDIWNSEWIMPIYAWEQIAVLGGFDTWEEFVEGMEDSEQFGCGCE